MTHLHQRKYVSRRNIHQILKQDLNVFAWTYSEMPGLDLAVAMHYTACLNQKDAP